MITSQLIDNLNELDGQLAGMSSCCRALMTCDPVADVVAVPLLRATKEGRAHIKALKSYLSTALAGAAVSAGGES